MFTKKITSSLLSVQEVAADLGVKPELVRKLALSGEIPAIRVGGKFIKFRREEVARYLERNRI